MLGRSYDANALPKLVMQFEQFKAGEGSECARSSVHAVVGAAALPKRIGWSIAKNASWQTTRMNLNTFARHGVFEEHGLAGLIAARLRDAGEIQRARVFPYQLLTAYQNCDEAVPQEVRDALQDAMELAIANVPSIEGQVVVCPDVSGSMSSPVTGHRGWFDDERAVHRCGGAGGCVGACGRIRSATVLPFEQCGGSGEI